MLEHFKKYPLFILVTMIGAVAMLIPAVHGAVQSNWKAMQIFLDFSFFVFVIAVITGLAFTNREPRISARSHLITVLLVYTVLPALLALPLFTLVPSMGFWQGYFEMLSSLTTTGASLIDDPYSVAETVHLWRAIVAWLGGFLILIIAFGIMEPMNLGGFEIRSMVTGSSVGAGAHGQTDASDKLVKYAKLIGPIYFVVTLVLAIILVMLGDRAHVAAIHAMSIISTSGITPLSELSDAPSGRLGEMAMVVFLLFAISHRWFESLTGVRNWQWLSFDVEIRLMMLVLILVPALLFFRHWGGAYDVATQENYVAALKALWGSFFTVASFLTTTGFESADWESARNWSGLDSPGIVVLALAIMGGGVATTAGGVKLLRIYALYKHGLREMERLVNPSSVGGAGMAARRFRREGAYIAWIFLTLFSFGIASLMILLSYNGVEFEESIALSISMLTNTGPAVHSMIEGFKYSELSISTQALLSIGMILGRVELLAIIALFNPNYWRR